jgi:hypothetical protein
MFKSSFHVLEFPATKVNTVFGIYKRFLIFFDKIIKNQIIPEAFDTFPQQ